MKIVLKIALLALSLLTIQNQKIYAQSSLPESLIFSEIFPNPIGEDTGSEWIEIQNNSLKDMNIKKWLIKKPNKKGSSYSIPLNKLLKPSETILIKPPFNINNTEEHLLLLNPDKITVHEISYKKSIEGESYSVIKTYDKSSLNEKISAEWEWTDNLTPEKPNFSYEILSGNIEKCTDNYFILKVKENFFKIHFYDFTPALAKSIFQKNKLILLKTQKINENSYLIKNFEIKNKNLNENRESKFPLSIIIIAFLPLIYFIKKSLKTGDGSDIQKS